MVRYAYTLKVVIMYDLFYINFLGPGSPPSNVSANVLTSTSILVFWDIVPPVDQNGVITEYEVVYVPQEDFMGRIGRNSTRVPAGSRSLTLSGLEEYVNYSISVQAFTVVGGGPNSEPITRLTLEAGMCCEARMIHKVYFIIKLFGLVQK